MQNNKDMINNVKWWESSVAYQIYPRSFQDSNNDGVGDLQGIISRLPYLKELGIGAVWLSPIYKSPMVDNGYDISDYRKIDEIFGSMDDFDELIHRANKLDIKIIMDLVLNHSSDQHYWFQDVLTNPESKYKEYYIIKNSINGDKPNNWRSLFGGSAWEKLPNSDEYYLHVFSKEQPDLNWENPELRQELYRIINWWIDKGVSGFRIDAINYIKKDQSFFNLEADGPDGLAMPKDLWCNAEGIDVFLKELKEFGFHKGKVFTVAEANNVRPGELNIFVGENGFFTSVFDFSYMDMDVKDGRWFDLTYFNNEDLKKAVFNSEKEIKISGGLGVPYIENHDQNRHQSKFLPNVKLDFYNKTVFNIMYFFLQGMPFIYQGQEIGMENYPWKSMDEFNDVSAFDQYKNAISFGLNEYDALVKVGNRARDNARTPMQWSAEEFAGFSTVQPWLNVNPNYKKINVESEQGKHSILNLFKQLIKLRKSDNHVFARGDFKPAFINETDVLAYTRSSSDKKYLIVCNLSNEEKSIVLDTKTKVKLLLSNYDYEFEKNRNKEFETVEKISLLSYEAKVLLIN